MSDLAWMVVAVSVLGVSPSERVADETVCRRIVAERNAGWVASRAGEFPPWLCLRLVVPAANACYRTTDSTMREVPRHAPPPAPAVQIAEPGGLALIGAGLAGLLLTRHRGATEPNSRPLARLRRIASLAARRPDGFDPRGNEGNAVVAGNRFAAKAMKRAAALVAGAAMLLAAGAAFAHQAPSGWEYDRECCSERDCEPAPRGVVREVEGGYRVVIAPGRHRMVPATGPGVDAFDPHGDRRIRVSGDDERHACIRPWDRAVLCIYIPPGGV